MTNDSLQRAMAERGLTQSELAEQVNVAIGDLTGTPGRISDRLVRQWLAGKVTWPHERQRRALENVLGSDPIQLGFHPRARSGLASRPLTLEEDDHVHRRAFIRAAVSSAAGAAVGTPGTDGSAGRVGSSDVDRLDRRFVAIIASDHRHGGNLSTEQRALGVAAEAIALLKSTTSSQRIRNRLYACAAAFTSSALWAAIDARRYDVAQHHLDRASSLAALSGDHSIEFRIWSHAGSLYRHCRRPASAIAANDVARRTPIARRDPSFASLGHARHAAILGLTGDRAAVKRALDHAHRAFANAVPDPSRPIWLTAFYDQAELESLSLAAHLALGDFTAAEAHAHRALGLLMPNLHRTRAITHARLALAQAGQGDLEPAVATAMTVPAEIATTHPRVKAMLQHLGHQVHAVAPNSDAARIWDTYVHDELRMKT